MAVTLTLLHAKTLRAVTDQSKHMATGSYRLATASP